MKRILLLTIGILQLASGAVAGQSATVGSSAPLDLEGYTAELRQWSASTRLLREHPGAAAALRRELTNRWSVAVQGQVFHVSTEWLAAALDRLAVDPRAAQEASREMSDRLDLMLRDARNLARIATPSYGQARAKLDGILKRREFRSVRAPSAQESLWEQFTDWIWEFFKRLFNRVGGHPAVTKIVLWGIVAAMGLAFLGWLISLLSHVSASKLSWRRSQASGDEPGAMGTWRGLVLEARDAARRGEYRDAVRIIYGAAVRRLGESGTWQVEPSRTHREYVRLLPANSAQLRPVVAITTRFECVWYGTAQATATDYEAVLAELESLG